jgi:hypothetical protein
VLRVAERETNRCHNGRKRPQSRTDLQTFDAVGPKIEPKGPLSLQCKSPSGKPIDVGSAFYGPSAAASGRSHGPESYQVRHQSWNFGGNSLMISRTRVHERAREAMASGGSCVSIHDNGRVIMGGNEVRKRCEAEQ